NSYGDTIRHYRLSVDSSYIHVHSGTVLPPYNEDWLKMLSVSNEEFLEEFNKFPSSRFRLEGFCLITVKDVSKNMAIELLKNAILHMHTSSIEEVMENVERAVGELLGYPGIKIGITPFFKINGKVVHDKCCVERFVGIHSSDKTNDKGKTLQKFYDLFTADPNPIILPYVDETFLRNNPSLKGLAENEIRSFLIYPLQTADGLLGIFELGSTEEGVISSKTIDLLQLSFPVIIDFVYYMLETFHNRIERLVKETFTPLQESVEWKFNEVAWKYLVKEDNHKTEKMDNVFFEKVFPLYGSVDIKDSTIKRNLSLKNDFIIQLRAILELLQAITAKVPLPFIDSLVYKCNKLLDLLSNDLSNENELKVREFLEEEVILFLNSVKTRLPQFAVEVEDYLEKTDPKTGEFHHYHNSYETSFQKINETITAYFQQEVEKQLKVYPFYYEKYRTDGIEYNMYLGQSIAPEIAFDPIYLKNLRLWQLSSMAHIALANHHMLETLLLPLQTTQLILVHSYPIDISFRKDERRFDVEGAYNIRYEMMKKRIDKVRIKDTMERLTQPDKIAIIYTSATDLNEYTQHISFLQSKNILTDDLEMLELEELQGLSGLKALRVSVNY
ncbi:MAG: hypothetical protein JWQ96_3317, partial [Segetibacter sp.]|nr:hypothetical protein [Segetibacter sp.]